MIRYPIPPMIHSHPLATDGSSGPNHGTGTGIQRRRGGTIHKHKVNLLFFTGDAMARPLVDALVKGNDWPVVVVPVAAAPRRCSRRASRRNS